MRQHLATAALLAGLTALPGAAWAQEATTAAQISQEDLQFVQTAAEGGMAEVQLGELAVDKASNEEVQAFGQRMVDDHGAANDKLEEIAGQKEIELPGEIPADAKATQERLDGLAEAEFDRAYVEQMVADHEKTIELFETQAQSGQDPELKLFAEETLPTLQDHLEHAQQLETQMSEMAGATGGEMDATSGAATTAARTDAGDASSGEATAGATTAGATDASPETTEPAAGAMTDGDTGAPSTATEATEDESVTTGSATTGAATDGSTAADATGGTDATDPTTTQQAALPPSALGSMTADELIGKEVVNLEGDGIGEISDIVINTQDQAVLAVISVGGFLGIGSKDVAVPFEQLQQGEGEAILLGSATEEELKQMPAYEDQAEGYEEYPRDQPLSSTAQ